MRAHMTVQAGSAKVRAHRTVQMSYNARWVRPLAFQRWVRAAKAYPTTSMAGQVRALWRKASQRKAIGESPTERRRNERQPTKACLPRHGPFAHPVCVAARKPHFRPGNPPRHVRSGTSVCAATSGAKRIFRSNYLSDNFVIISIISTFAPCE